MIKKLTFHEIAWYFFIFSILGMILENLLCLSTTGIIESRKGFIIGPFCPIYGLGAIILIMFLEPYKNKPYKIFLYGMFVGASFEYYSSYVMQALYGVKFWDYPKYFMNINGRTCLLYAACWGILSAILIYFAKPIIDKFIEKNKSDGIDKVLIGFMILNSIVTYVAINSYMYRVELKYSSGKVLNGLISNTAMETIFPNMIYVNTENNKILVSQILDRQKHVFNLLKMEIM